MNVHPTLIEVWRNTSHNRRGIGRALAAGDSSRGREGNIQSERAAQCLCRGRAEKERTQIVSAAQGADAQCSCAGKGRVTGETQLRDSRNCPGRRAGDGYLIGAGSLLTDTDDDQGQKAKENGLEKCGSDKPFHSVPPCERAIGHNLRWSVQAREHAGQVRSYA